MASTQASVGVNSNPTSLRSGGGATNGVTKLEVEPTGVELTTSDLPPPLLLSLPSRVELRFSWFCVFW